MLNNDARTRVSAPQSGKETDMSDADVLRLVHDCEVEYHILVRRDRRPNALLFAGDIGHRIFQQPFSWKALGVDVRGRSRTLRVNYRTSHQIRQQADRLMEQEITDVDGIAEKRGDTVSVFNGPVPKVLSFATEQDEVNAVAEWLRNCVDEGESPHEIGVFVRSEA